KWQWWRSSKGGGGNLCGLCLHPPPLFLESDRPYNIHNLPPPPNCTPNHRHPNHLSPSPTAL
uniref:Uncharacterized protein n=2 Tax=Ixodes scapularis TaxID=6945 RepID=A0A1S4LJV9_IXOSC